jgi:hypothetical protein
MIHSLYLWVINSHQAYGASQTVMVCILFLLLGVFWAGLGFLLFHLRIIMFLCDLSIFLRGTIVSSDGKIRMRYLWEGR